MDPDLGTLGLNVGICVFCFWVILSDWAKV